MAQAAGTKVAGKAQPGDKVTYSDMANQDGKVWEVMVTAEENTDPRFGWSKGYSLVAVGSLETTYSDLRQSGWTFA